MQHSQLISLRLDATSLEAIDKICEPRKYLNRSRVINCLLSAMLHCCTGSGLFDVLNCYDPVSDGIKIVVLTKNQH